MPINNKKGENSENYILTRSSNQKKRKKKKIRHLICSCPLHTLPLSLFSSPPFWLLHFDSVLVLWNLTVESILSETKWYFTSAAVSCCNFLFKHLYAPAMPFKTSELSYCVMTEWSAGRGDATVARGFKMRAIVLNCIVFLLSRYAPFNSTALSLTCSLRQYLGVIPVHKASMSNIL